MGSQQSERMVEDGADVSEELERARVAVRGADMVPSDAAHAAVFAAVSAEAQREDASWLGALRAKPTSMRRLLALGALGLIVAMDLTRYAQTALDQAPLRVAVGLSVFGVLTVLLLLTSLHPMHRPPISRRAEAWLVAGSLVAALGLSLWPSGDMAASITDAWRGALPCLIYGVVVAVPVYLVARIIDRGSWATGFLAAFAAGLSANFVLMVHCPTAGADHMLLGHFGVIAALLLAYGAWSRLRAR